MGEDGLHGEGLLDGGADLEAAATAGTGEDIEVEHAALSSERAHVAPKLVTR